VSGELLEVPDVQERFPARPDVALERLFFPRPVGYLGADVAMSIPLSAGRTLWVFGDTLVGALEKGRRRFDSMPRNSAALVVDETCGTAEPQWLVPLGIEDTFVPPGGGSTSWFWPGTGFHHAGRVYVIGYEVVQGDGPCESLSFAITGMRMFRIEGVEQDPRDWRITSVPFGPPNSRTFFCSGNLVEGEYVYLLGTTRFVEGSAEATGGVMARIPIADLKSDDPAARMQVLSAFSSWTSADEEYRILFRPGVTECSLYHDVPRERYLATTYDPREGLMRVTTAPRLEGPWCEPFVVYRVPEFKGWERHHAYTFRMHPHLATSADEMVFTYVVNTKGLETVLDEMDVYYPRFLRADLRTLQPPTDPREG
jgi:hypothetical protein